MCKVWLGRTQGKEEEKSNLLTSKSCTTGTSREGGHAATKHRETEITITAATAQPPPTPRANTASRARGAVTGGPCLPETRALGKEQSLVLSGPGTAPWPPEQRCTTQEPCPDRALPQRPRRAGCSGSPSFRGALRQAGAAGRGLLPARPSVRPHGALVYRTF